MPLFPQTFLDDLRLQADIVQVVQESVSLRRVGNRYSGLCPFHGEKTPSFSVNREQGFFHCFGCGVGGNVFKFVELRDRVSFPEAVRLVAQKFGVALPEVAAGDRDVAAEHESLLKIHEVAAAFYREVLASADGTRGRELLTARGVRPETSERLGYGFAPPGRDALLSRLRRQGFAKEIAVKSGLIVDREGRLADRFWNRLMIPIARESGSVVAFGGRAMDTGQVPKYLNSPETPIYSKSRTLYGLEVTRSDVSKQGYAVLVEGYFDFAQAWQAGVTPVVATCGTALTKPQAEKLRRFASRAVLSFDPDAAGQTAAVRSCELLVGEGFQVSVALLPRGQDPDVFVREQGGPAYQAVVDEARPYLDFLIDRTAKQHDLAVPAQRLAFLNAMLAVAAGIPDAAARDQFADRLAHRAGITEEVVRQEIRRSAVARQASLAPQPDRVLRSGKLLDAERDLLIRLITDPITARAALPELELTDFDGLSARDVFDLVLSFDDHELGRLPDSLIERLTEQDASFVLGLPRLTAKPNPAADCVRTLKARKYEREKLRVQQQIDSVQEHTRPASDAELNELLARKMQDARAAHAE